MTGGTSQPDWSSTLTSTSLLTEGSSAWKNAAPLPSARSELRAVTVPLSGGGHRVIVTGTYIQSYTPCMSLVSFWLLFRWNTSGWCDEAGLCAGV